ncbi:hypothetical protein GCM10010151_31370 [Actinoallomurus spadix]|uniref:Uncharacterized protein n=1 Tax=Actinoallomurus spadix TaxID=79912 RepID=A0ABP3GC71_9ACTN
MDLPPDALYPYTVSLPGPSQAPAISTRSRCGRRPEPRSTGRAAGHCRAREDTFSAPGVPLREHAHLLPRLERWVLFPRP